MPSLQHANPSLPKKRRRTSSLLYANSLLGPSRRHNPTFHLPSCRRIRGVTIVSSSRRLSILTRQRLQLYAWVNTNGQPVHWSASLAQSASLSASRRLPEASRHVRRQESFLPIVCEPTNSSVNDGDDDRCQECETHSLLERDEATDDRSVGCLPARRRPQDAACTADFTVDCTRNVPSP
jgi:hypothetical protein